jgi:hypothetical protein
MYAIAYTILFPVAIAAIFRTGNDVSLNKPERLY